MSFWSKVKSTYRSVDTKLGGYLPGGVTPAETKTTTSTVTKSTPTTSTPTTAPKSTTSTSSESGSSGGSYDWSGKVENLDTGDTKYYYEGEEVGQISGGGSSATYTPTSNKNVALTFQKGTTEEQVRLTQEKATIDYKQMSALNQALSSGGGTFNTGANLYKKDNRPFYVGDQRKEVVQYGALFVTPQEAKQLKGGSTSYWEIESKTMKEGIKEGSFAGNIPYIQSNVKTRGTYEYNTQSILAGKQIYNQYTKISKDFEADPKKFSGQAGVVETQNLGGTSYELTPEYFKNKIDTEGIYKNSLVGAKDQYSTLSDRSKRTLNFGGYAQGVTSSVIGIGEFAGTIGTNLGVQKLDNNFNPLKSNKFYFGRSLGKIRALPSTASTDKFLDKPGSYLKQKSTSPEVLGQATVIVPLIFQGAKSLITNIKQFGFKGGVAETASGFSPIRIKSGIYSESITSKTTFTNVKSYKITSKEGITTRVYSGSSGSIKLAGIEKSSMVGGQKVGAGFTTTQTPYTEIRGGGSIIKSGIRTTVNPYSFEGAGAGSVSKVRGNQFFNQILGKTYKGGTSNILTSKGFTAYTSSEGSTIYNNINIAYRSTGGGVKEKVGSGVSKFVSGKAKPIYETTYYGDTRINLGEGTYSKDFISQPSGKYKLVPKIAGVEFDLNAILGSSGGKSGSYSISGGAGGSSTVTKLGSTGVSAIVVPSVNLVSVNSPSLFLPTKATGNKQELFKSTYKPINVFSSQSMTKIKAQTKEASINVVLPKVSSGSGSRSRSKSATISIAKTEAITKAKSKSDTIQSVKIVQLQRIKLDNKQKLSSTYSYGGSYSGMDYGYKYNYTPPTPVPFVLPLLRGMPSGSLGLGRVKGRKSETRYTPSFTALFYKLKGKAPKGKETGLKFRPITKGFSFFGKRKIKRVIKIKQ